MIKLIQIYGNLQKTATFSVPSKYIFFYEAKSKLPEAGLCCEKLKYYDDTEEEKWLEAQSDQCTHK